MADANAELPIEVLVTARNATDPEFIGRSSGYPFYAHLQGAERIVEFRLNALNKASARYKEASVEARPEPEVAGYGLLVIQRAVLLAEDLGGLLHAVVSADPWQGLTSYYASDLDDLYKDIVEKRREIADFLVLPTDEDLDASPKVTAEVRDAAIALRQLTLDQLADSFEAVSAFWLSHREAAKTTMHGFGVLAAEHLIAPPGGGKLSEVVPIDGERPFAVALVSRTDRASREIRTTPHWLDLTRESIRLVWATAVAAGDLYLFIARLHRDVLRRADTWTLPTAFANQLPPEQQRALRDASV